MNTAKTRIQQEFEDKDLYKIRIIYSDGDKGTHLNIATTGAISRIKQSDS